MSAKVLPGTLFEMMRSFVAVAETQNVAKASRQLNLTRHTVVRHIAELQKLRNQTLFDRSDRSYELTDGGKQAYTEAKALLQNTIRWMDKPHPIQTEFTKEMFAGKDDYILVQEHPILDVWKIAPPLLQSGLTAWVEAKGQLEHPALEKIRPYLIMFREHNEGWMCIEVGEESSLMSWLGWKWAKSAIGTILDTAPVGTTNNRHMVDAYHQTSASGGVCYEHVCSRLPSPQHGEVVNVNYQRLIFSCLLPDQEKIIASLAFRTNSIIIDHLDQDQIPKMTSEFEM